MTSFVEKEDAPFAEQVTNAMRIIFKNYGVPEERLTGDAITVSVEPPPAGEPSKRVKVHIHFPEDILNMLGGTRWNVADLKMGIALAAKGGMLDHLRPGRLILQAEGPLARQHIADALNEQLPPDAHIATPGATRKLG